MLEIARHKVVSAAKRTGISLKQTYAKECKTLRRKAGGYAHAKQFRRLKRVVKRQRTILGIVMREVQRKLEEPGFVALNAKALSDLTMWLERAERIRTQQRHDKKKLYALHAPEVECIGKGKAHKPYEFGVKVSIATTLNHSGGGQFIAHAKALPGNPYDGHTLASVLPDMQKQIGGTINCIVADKGYRGHNAPKDYKFKVYISGQKRGLTDAIKRDLRRRSAVEPVIGHAKSEHRMDRNYLKGSQGDAINAVLAAAGYNFRRLLAWLRRLLRVWMMLMLSKNQPLSQAIAA